jgi:hypothetical protein
MFSGFSRKNTLSIYQKKLAEHVDYNEFEKFYSLFISFFSTLSKIPKHKLSEDLIKIELVKHKVKEKEIESFLKFLKECAQYSFALLKMPSQEIEIIKNKANNWLIFLNNIYKK